MAPPADGMCSRAAGVRRARDRGVFAHRVGPLVCLLGVLTALVGAGPAAAAATGFVPALGQTVDGPQKATDLGVGWVRLFVNWNYTETAEGAYTPYYVNRFRDDVAAYHARGVKVLAVVTASPQWASGDASGIGAPTDPTRYAAFVDHMIVAAPGIEAWEVWNEADENVFWENGPNPGAYAALLRATYPVIKARSPAATVVSTGMVANDYAFLAALYANGAQGFFDAVAVHTDTACLLATPDHFYREADGRVGRYAFTGYREVHDVMAVHGDGGKPIWMTELGWNTSSTAASSCRDGGVAGTRAAGVSEAEQASDLTHAYACLAADPYLAVAMWFALQDIPGSQSYSAHLGLLRTDGSAKPAYAAMRALRNGAAVRADPACGGRVDHQPPTVHVASPTDGLRFSDRLSLAASAADEPGGTGVHDIELLADGRHVLNFKGSSLRLTPWFRSRGLTAGPHTLTFRAHDNAGNATEQTVKVVKVGPGELAAVTTATRLDRPRLRGRRITLRSEVSYGPTDLPRGGRVYVSIEQQIGRRHRRVKLVSAKASAPFALTLRLGAGRYRALASYRSVAPFAPSHSRYRGFTVR